MTTHAYPPVRMQGDAMYFVRVESTCSCGDVVTFTLPPDRYERLQGGESAEVVFPELTAEQRRRLTTGYCPKHGRAKA